jgi:hypothetical protein
VCSRACTLSQYRTKLLLLSHNFSNVMINNTSSNEAHYSGPKVKRTAPTPICKLWSAPLAGVMISTSSSSSEKFSVALSQSPQAQVSAKLAAAYSYLLNQSLPHPSYCLPLNYWLKETWLYLRATGGLISVPRRLLISLLPRVVIALSVGGKWEAQIILLSLSRYM